jgi:hypothetical protein
MNGAVKYSALWCRTVHFIIVQCSTTYSSVQYRAMHNSAVQHWRVQNITAQYWPLQNRKVRNISAHWRIYCICGVVNIAASHDTLDIHIFRQYWREIIFHARNHSTRLLGGILDIYNQLIMSRGSSLVNVISFYANIMTAVIMYPLPCLMCCSWYDDILQLKTSA